MNRSCRDLSIRGLGTSSHLAKFLYRTKPVSGSGDQVWGIRLEDPSVGRENFVTGILGNITEIVGNITERVR